MARRIVRHATLALLTLLAAACGGGPVPEPVTPVPLAAPATDEPTTNEDVSFLEVLSAQPTEIKIDGKSVGKTPVTGYKVASGQHEITFVFAEDNSQTISVTTEPNKGQTVKLDPVPNATGTMHGDEVKRGGDGGGKKDGDAPIKKKKKAKDAN